MLDKGNGKILLMLFVLLAVMIVILASAIGVKTSNDQDSAGVVKAEVSAETKDTEKQTVNAVNTDVKEPAADAGNTDIKEPAADAESTDTKSSAVFTADDYPADEEIRAALMAYQEYVDEYDDMQYFDGYLLAYLDEDDIPELIAIGSCEAAGQVIITYRDGELQENYIGRLGGLRYVKKQNFYYNSNGNMGSYRDEFFRLVNGEQIVIMSGRWGDKRDEEGKIILNEAGDYPEQEYVWDGTVCTEEEYYNAIDGFIKETVGDAELIKVNGYDDDLYDTIPEAYEGLKYRKYSAFGTQIKEFALENGVLTYSVVGDGYYGWGDSDEVLYTISYPVAKDCIWEERDRGRGEHYRLEVADTDYIRHTTFTEIKERIDTDKGLFDEAASGIGKDKARVERPIRVVVVVKEGVVVRVYTVSF